MNNTTQRVWLITGATSGFGRALTEAAIAAGDIVIGAARSPERLDDLVAAHQDQLEAVELDVTDAPAISRLVEDLVRRYGRIDVLVNNAGRTQVGAVEETTDAELRDLFELHFFGPAALTRAVLPHFRERRSGAIVMLSSMGGQLSFAGFSAYSSTKFAVEGFAEALADEVSPYGIKVLVVEPGAFRTGLFGKGAAVFSEPLAAYDASVGETRRMVQAGDGTQAGDPAKAAAAILTALAAESTPLRLPLGGDAVDAIRGHLDRVGAELDQWEAVARDTAFAAEPAS
ncbi:oxidoreductase [Microlunatus parietis]|uniref:NAD(P)-dependent dehydrogenase (Short-subunit alcohol dehydrogenase family) n=1 Tax=Microlunatus parietis TaxID=682979 RepID=A0A7Y9LAW7_9ACTN|nr:oxidoreductase [Microlunatus parietis]NYE71117.1 NAD(P)-dependent dehydrogenase (short-subunit alcohol dehydrogenase family) [Microlunatus parietis]